MTSLDLAFAACGLLAVVAGLLAVTTRQVVHAALWLVVALLGVAGCLLVLGHEGSSRWCSSSSTSGRSSSSCSSRSC